MIIGIIILSIGLIPIITAKNVKEIKNDLDVTTENYKSYDNGDKIVITGKIITVIETKYLLLENYDKSDDNLEKEFGGKYIYIFEKNLEVYSNKEIGKIGDNVFVECEIKNINNGGREEEILKADPSFNPLLIIVIGLGFLIIGTALASFMIRKKRQILRTASKPYKLAKIYENIQEYDEESTMYQFLHSKAQKPGSSKNLSRGDTQASIIKQRRLRIEIPPQLVTKTIQPNTLTQSSSEPLQGSASAPMAQPLPTLKPRAEIDNTALQNYYSTMQAQTKAVPRATIQQPTLSNVASTAPMAQPQPTYKPQIKTDKAALHKVIPAVQGQTKKEPKVIIKKRPAVKKKAITPPAQPRPTTRTTAEFDHKALMEYYRSLEAQDDENVLYRSMQTMDKK